MSVSYSKNNDNYDFSPRRRIHSTSDYRSGPWWNSRPFGKQLPEDRLWGRWKISFRSYNCYPIELNLCGMILVRMILDIILHIRLEPEFSVSPRGAVKSVRFEIFKWIHSLQSSSIELNFVGWYETSVCTIVRSRIFRFPTRGAVGARPLKYSNRFTALGFGPTELKLCKKILDTGPHSHSKRDFSISLQGPLLGHAPTNL